MNRPLQDLAGGAAVSLAVTATCKGRGGDYERLVCVAEETPVAFRYNGFAYAVMMATPDDLEDFAIGFSVSEGIIARAAELPDLSVLSCGDGITIEMLLKGEDLHRYLSTRRVRRLQGHTSCGLCGVEDL